MDNNLQKYIAFVKTVEMGSFTKAALALNYFQSSVSKMIQDLEKEWHMTLLERDRSGVHLTGSGAQLLPYARTLIDDYNRLLAHVNELNGVLTGTIRIGTFSSAAIHWLPEIIAEFQKDYPGIEYELLLGDYDEIERWIDNGRVDLGFLSLPATKDFDVFSLRCDEYMIVLPENHRLASCREIDIRQLEGEPFMLLEHGGRTEVTKLLEQSLVHPHIKFTTWEDFAIMSMVEKGLGVSILPQMILQRIPYRIAIRPMLKPFYREIGIAVKNQKHLSPAVRTFMEYIMRTI